MKPSIDLSSGEPFLQQLLGYLCFFQGIGFILMILECLLLKEEEILWHKTGWLPVFKTSVSDLQLNYIGLISFLQLIMVEELYFKTQWQRTQHFLFHFSMTRFDSVCHEYLVKFLVKSYWCVILLPMWKIFKIKGVCTDVRGKQVSQTLVLSCFLVCPVALIISHFNVDGPISRTKYLNFVFNAFIQCSGI